MITTTIKIAQEFKYYKSNNIIDIAKGKYELITFKNLLKKLIQKLK